MEFIKTYAKEIFALLVPLFVWLLGNKFRAGAILQLARPQSFTFQVDGSIKDENNNITPPGQTVHTASHLLGNSGKETATRVELVFNWKPLCMNVWPSRHFEEHTEKDGRYILIFDSLAPDEKIGLELLSVNRELPYLVNARCDQCTSTTIDMSPQPVYPAWKRRVEAMLVLAGIAFIIYISILLLKFLIID